jgi:hypothetical protein
VPVRPTSNWPSLSNSDTSIASLSPEWVFSIRNKGPKTQSSSLMMTKAVRKKELWEAHIREQKKLLLDNCSKWMM